MSVNRFRTVINCYGNFTGTIFSNTSIIVEFTCFTINNYALNQIIHTFESVEGLNEFLRFGYTSMSLMPYTNNSTLHKFRGYNMPISQHQFAMQRRVIFQLVIRRIWRICLNFHIPIGYDNLNQFLNHSI